MDYDYSVSARRKLARQPISVFLELAYPKLTVGNEIKTVFGFAERCSLYGGRSFTEPELSQKDIHWLYDNGIGYRIPIQNVMPTYADYQREKEFLEKYHRDGNVVIVAKNEMAEWIRNDFPKYKIEGSFIRRYDAVEKVMDDLGIYDTIVPDPAVFGEDFEMLDKLPRDRVRLFTNAWCGFKCKRRQCYAFISAQHLGRKVDSIPFCSEEGIREKKEFDVDRYKQMGFHLFKSMSVSSRIGGF